MTDPFSVAMPQPLAALQVSMPLALDALAVAMPGKLGALDYLYPWVTEEMGVWVDDSGAYWAAVMDDGKTADFDNGVPAGFV